MTTDPLLYTRSEIDDQLENGVDDVIRPLEFFMEFTDEITKHCNNNDFNSILYRLH